MAEYGPGTGTPDYPAYRFHLEHGMRLVQNEAADEALGTGWRDRPYTDEDRAAAAKDLGADTGFPPMASGEGPASPRRR